MRSAQALRAAPRSPETSLASEIPGDIGAVRLGIQTILGAVEHLVKREQATRDGDSHQVHGF